MAKFVHKTTNVSLPTYAPEDTLYPNAQSIDHRSSKHYPASFRQRMALRARDFRGTWHTGSEFNGTGDVRVKV